MIFKILIDIFLSGGIILGIYFFIKLLYDDYKRRKNVKGELEVK